MKKDIFPQWGTLLFLGGTFFYYELLFQWSTLGSVFSKGSFWMLVLCLGYAGFGYLLTSLAKKRRTNRIITAVYLFLAAVPFLVEYFVYKQFKLLYDVNTVFAGAGDALQSYWRETLQLIFSGGGLLRIALYFLPGILYLVIGRSPRQANWKSRLISAGAGLLLILVSVLGISCSGTLRAICTTQYSFEAAVDNFGFVAGLGLDAGRLCFGVESDFVDDDIPDIPAPTEPSESTDTTEPTEPPVVYVPNQLELDLDDPNASKNIAKINQYVSGLTASMQNPYTGMFKGKNLIFLTAEAFSLEVIDPYLTPTLYRLSKKGIQFKEFYQLSGAGTTGGEYQNVFGMLPTNGGQSFKDTASHLNYYTIGSMLDREGYYGWAFHNNSWTYYDRNKTHCNIGYSEGFMGRGNGMEEFVPGLWPQSDLDMLKGTIPMYIDKAPFNIYYMTVSGHSGYTRTGNSMTKKNWSRVEHLDYSDTVKGYIAAQLELEDALAYLLEQLEAAGIADDTVICLAADHFPYGLDDDAALGNMPYLSELYGYEVTTSFQRDHNGLILWCGELEDREPIVVETPVSSLDILPTLANLFGVEFDSRLLPGRDVFSDAPALVFTSGYNWITEYGYYYAGSGEFTQTRTDVTLPEGYVKSVTATVRNKVSYCDLVLDNDYFRYLFG
ncbi:MAG: sulfatase-like hydrolase/transferase [Oscillospiraceae bacterium]|nr:sulfatase-like hydrolase/transferase [Oscillospiraceae bacterium]